ncbi:MAG TPA: Gfo/Idh/MocA family oxidoreductase [Propylenella sp.]
MKRIGVALVGAGFIADYHLTGLAAVPEAEVRLIVGRTRAKTQALAQRFGIADVETDLEAALARDDVDAVVVTTPDDTHEEIALRCAAAGKAILLQKPMATSSEACRRIIAAAARAGVDLQVSFMHRHFPEVVAARRFLADGAIGDITSVRIRNATPGPDWGDWFFKRDQCPGGAVLQLGVHGIDLVDHLVGPVAAVSARTATLRTTRKLADGRTVEVENADSAWCIYEISDSCVASHEISMIETQGCDRFRCEIYGTNGTMWLRTERGPLSIFDADNSAGWFRPELPAVSPGERQHRLWIDGLLGRAPPEDTAAAGLRGLLTAEAIARSARNGGCREPVELPAEGART